MTKEDLIDYVADMASQLATLCRETLPIVSKLLDIAAEAARDYLR